MVYKQGGAVLLIIFQEGTLGNLTGVRLVLFIEWLSPHCYLKQLEISAEKCVLVESLEKFCRIDLHVVK